VPTWNLSEKNLSEIIFGPKNLLFSESGFQSLRFEQLGPLESPKIDQTQETNPFWKKRKPFQQITRSRVLKCIFEKLYFLTRRGQWQGV